MPSDTASNADREVTVMEQDFETAMKPLRHDLLDAFDSATEEAELALPALTKTEDGAIADMNTGEVLSLGNLAVLLGLTEDEAASFHIDDETSAEQYVGRMVHIQKEIETFAEMARAMIAHALSQYRHLQYRYDIQLRAFCEEELARYRKGDQYSRKYVRFMRGGAYFRKTGGVKMVDRQETQAWVESLPEEKLEEYQIKTVRKFDYHALMRRAREGEKIPGFDQLPIDELGKMTIGTTKGWSANRLRTMLGAIVDQLPAPEQEWE